METKWTNLLLEKGDVFERNASKDFALHTRFPRYCEVWGRYVFPNRDREYPLRFRSNFPPELEDLFNHHYGIWYHLTFAHRQIVRIHESEAIIDIGDPLFHLATTVDLTEKVLILAFILKQRISGIAPFSEATYVPPTKVYWSSFWSNIGIEETSCSKFFNDNFANFRKFGKIAYERIRRYRNLMVHSLPPLMPVDEQERKVIPRVKVLKKYEGGRWTSIARETISQDFVRADVQLKQLADQLVEALDVLWENLLKILEDVANSEEYRSFLSGYVGMMIDEFYKFGPEEIDWGPADSITPLDEDWYTLRKADHPIPPTHGTISPLHDWGNDSNKSYWTPDRPSANADVDWPIEDND